MFKCGRFDGIDCIMQNDESETTANSHVYLKFCFIKDYDFVVSRVFEILKPYTEMFKSKSCDFLN
jgi:hypothetical protein